MSDTGAGNSSPATGSENPWNSDELFAVASKSILGRKLTAELSSEGKFLETLALDEELEVRRAVARNPHTPVAVLQNFSQDTDNQLLIALLSNPTSPLSVLEILAQDRKSVV